MAIERTFSIVKPDAVAKNIIGKIYSRFESGGLKIVASRMVHLTKEQAGSALEAMMDAVTDALKNGDDVRLLGFGNFSVTHRPAKMGRNPQTGAQVQIKAANLPKFKAGKGLKDKLN